MIRPPADERYGYPFTVPEFPEAGPAEAVNTGPPTEPRPAATIILLRDGPDDGELDVLLLKRSPEARFMPNVWVFPGGSLDPGDGQGEAGLRACARRELAEEAGLALAPDQELVTMTRWVTPEVVQTRFDTWFFLARTPETAGPVPDGQEMTDSLWISPGTAVERAEEGELAVSFPTLKQLQVLALFPDTDAAIRAAAENRTAAEPILPKVVGTEDDFRVLLPGEDGYPAD